MTVMGRGDFSVLHGSLHQYTSIYQPSMKHLLLFTALGLLILAAGYGCAGDKSNAMQHEKSSYAAKVKEAYLAGIARFDTAVTRLDVAVREMSADSLSNLSARTAYVEARLAYKRVECLSEHFFPETGRALNGALLDEVEDDDPNHVVLGPEGLQVIEEKLYAEPAVPGDDLREDIITLRANAKRLRLLAEANEFSDQNIFDAMFREVIRVISLGLAGFDTPAAGTSVREAAAALEGIRECYAVYGVELREKAPREHRAIDSLFAAAIAHLESNPEFLQFDQLQFIRAYANPIYAALHRAQSILKIPFPDDRRAVSVNATSIFEHDAFDPLFFAPSYALKTGPDHAALGRLLFFDPVLSGNESRACASCHRPELAFTDGMSTSTAFDNKGHVARNAPTLINAGLQGSSFFDGRVSYLEDQATDVLANPAEMHGSMEVAVAKLRRSPDYVKMFEKAYGSGEKAVSDLHIRVALASYIRSLVSSNAPFDRYVGGENAAMPETAKRGFNLFMGKAKCGTCHFMPLFNGAVPPTFAKTEVEILGVTQGLDTLQPKLDQDLGRFNVHRIEIHRHAFKTPTLRNIELTAPYMHNGAFATLEDVMEFYDHGGGAGMGLDVPNQTLPPDRLNLTDEEEADIIAFLKALTDTTNLPGRPERLPEMAGVASARSVGGRY